MSLPDADRIAQLQAAGRAPRRTIRVVLFGNEENGFDGARAYGTRYQAQRRQLVGESDFGAGAIYALRSRVDTASKPAFEAMAQVLAPLGVPLTDNNASPGPDAAMLMRRHQWPAVSLSQDGISYFDVHHSAPGGLGLATARNGFDRPAQKQPVAKTATSPVLPPDGHRPGLNPRPPAPPSAAWPSSTAGWRAAPRSSAG